MTRKKKKRAKKNIIKPNFLLLPESAVGTKHEIACSIYRGKVIHYIVDLEDIMEWILIEYYVMDENLTRTFFRASIMCTERFSLNFKWSAVLFLIKNEFAEFYTRHQYINSEMEDLMSLRNDLAHNKFSHPNKNEDSMDLFLIQINQKSSKIKYDTTLLNDDTLKVFYGKYHYMRKFLIEVLLMVRELRK